MVADFIVAKGTIISTEYNDKIIMKIDKILDYQRDQRFTFAPLKENDEVSILLLSIFRPDNRTSLNKEDIDKIFSDFVSSNKNRTITVYMLCSETYCEERQIYISE